MEHFLAWALITLVSAFIGSYLGGYLKTKGTNLATHEDLDKLVKQMAATTAATKAIEAKIDSEMWNRQRHWELKRDAVLEVIQALGRANDSLQMLGATAARELDGGTPSKSWDAAMHPQMKSWQQARDAFDNKRFTAAFLCGDEFGNALRDLATNMGAAASVGVSQKPFSKSTIFFPIELEIRAVLEKGRRELGIQQPPNGKNHEVAGSTA